MAFIVRADNIKQGRIITVRIRQMARPRAYNHDVRCPRCGSNWTPKDGRSRGKQTYRCGCEEGGETTVCVDMDGCGGRERR